METEPVTDKIGYARSLRNGGRQAIPAPVASLKSCCGCGRAGSDQRAQRLFFAQIEAAETVIFLVEGAEHCKRGMPPTPKEEPGAQAKAAGFRAVTGDP